MYVSLQQVKSFANIALTLYAPKLMLTHHNKYSIYGAAQCTGDLSSENCMKCLDVAIEKLPSQSHGRRGWQVYYIRFELYSF
ncbi:hypothetical protein ACE6H2_016590 [Prunus campanulata]